MREIHRDFGDVSLRFRNSSSYRYQVTTSMAFAGEMVAARDGAGQGIRDEMRTDFCHRNPVLSRFELMNKYRSNLMTSSLRNFLLAQVNQTLGDSDYSWLVSEQIPHRRPMPRAFKDTLVARE